MISSARGLHLMPVGGSSGSRWTPWRSRSMLLLPRRGPMPEVALREGWTRVCFGDVVKLSGERSGNPERDGFERFVGLDHIDPEDLKIRRWGDVADGTTFTTVFRPGQ